MSGEIRPSLPPEPVEPVVITPDMVEEVGPLVFRGDGTTSLTVRLKDGRTIVTPGRFERLRDISEPEQAAD